MAEDVKEFDEMEKLLADVQRIIRDNEQFVRFLKEESVDPEGNEEDDNVDTKDDEYEEL